MQEPETILPSMTRIRTNEALGYTGGFLIAQRHLDAQQPSAFGVILDVVAGHGGDVYWVAHVGGTCRVAYGWMDFELAPPANPCGECRGTGIDWQTTQEKKQVFVACSSCHGSAEGSPLALTTVGEPVKEVRVIEYCRECGTKLTGDSGTTSRYSSEEHPVEMNEQRTLHNGQRCREVLRTRLGVVEEALVKVDHLIANVIEFSTEEVVNTKAREAHAVVEAALLRKA